MVADLKACGLLTEVVGQFDQRATVVGIGLNVNVDPAQAGLPPTATSLRSVSGRTWSRPRLLHAILDRIDAGYALEPSLLVQERVWPRWEALLWRRRQEVRVAEGGTVVEGVVEGLGPTGVLRLRDAHGTLHEISVGDVLPS
jgi:biotin-(acetyl-CoA carboxylase) ligase